MIETKQAREIKLDGTVNPGASRESGGVLLTILKTVADRHQTDGGEYRVRPGL